MWYSVNLFWQQQRVGVVTVCLAKIVNYYRKNSSHNTFLSRELYYLNIICGLCCLGVELKTPSLVEGVQNGVVREQFFSVED